MAGFFFPTLQRLKGISKSAFLSLYMPADPVFGTPNFIPLEGLCCNEQLIDYQYLKGHQSTQKQAFSWFGPHN